MNAKTSRWLILSAHVLLGSSTFGFGATVSPELLWSFDTGG